MSAPGASGSDPAVIGVHVAAVHERIRRAGGDPARVGLVAVTKGFGVDVVRAALAAGLVELGENYAQELLAKHAELDALPAPSGPRWHFIGRLQRNKVRQLAPLVSMWHTVDRVELGQEIARRAPGARVLVQLNLSGEPQKGGCEPGEAAALVARLRSLDLDVAGLMGVAPMGEPEAARPGFRLLVGLADELGLPERSIGMSADLEVAVEEGATLVRVGRGLFGPRPPRP
ncbi:MAG: YggS family pyridoxal phosphate-dependent enzyme [Acidimicrobiales bacterium]|nr:YggS family pyridoxal phosphate-dependent enzyme [Acidimicrobiales bacterium]